MTLIDLTAELEHGMVRHPAPHLPPVEVVPVATHEVQRRSVQKVTFGTHVSTHIDAPRHAIPDGATIDQIPVETFIGDAAMLRLHGVSRADPIDVVHLRPFQRVLKHETRIVLETGWARDRWGGVAYFTEGPYLTRAAAQYLAEYSVNLIVTDFPNIDSNEETKPGIPAPNHVILLGKGVVLVENVLRLHEISCDRFRLIALPLRLVGGDGCPCRVVAEV